MMWQPQHILVGISVTDVTVNPSPLRFLSQNQTETSKYSQTSSSIRTHLFPRNSSGCHLLSINTTGIFGYRGSRTIEARTADVPLYSTTNVKGDRVKENLSQTEFVEKRIWADRRESPVQNMIFQFRDPVTILQNNIPLFTVEMIQFSNVRLSCQFSIAIRMSAVIATRNFH